MGGSFSGPRASQAKIISLLKQTPFFVVFEEDELEQCAKFFSMKKYDVGGEVKDCDFIVVVSGLLSIGTLVPLEDKVNNKKIHLTEKLCVKKPGDFFISAAAEAMGQGQKVVSQYDFTTVKAVEVSKLLVLNRRKQQDYYTSCSDRAHLLEKVLSTNFSAILNPIPFLSELPRTKMNMFTEMLSFESCMPDHIIMAEGDLSDKFYLLISGTLQISAKGFSVDSTLIEDLHGSGKRTSVSIATLSSGSFFGETALVCDIPRSATVKSTTKCLLAAVTASNFRAFQKVCPSAKEAIEKHTKTRMLERLCTLGASLLLGLPRVNIPILAEDTSIRQYSADEVILGAKDARQNLFIIIHGTVEEVKDDGTCLKISQGVCFDESMLVDDALSSSTFKAVNGMVVVLVLPHKSVKENFPKLEEFAIEYKIRMGGPDVLKLDMFLKHTIGNKLFREHLAKEFSSECLHFVEKSDEFLTQLRSKSLEKSKADNQFKELLTMYILDSAPCQVNIPDNQRETLSAHNEVSEKAIEDLTAAQTEIMLLMERDAFSRFKQLAAFTDFLSSVGYSQP